jgi:hypothetical protein
MNFTEVAHITDKTFLRNMIRTVRKYKIQSGRKKYRII